MVDGLSDWERGYDEGFYEGVRNATHLVIRLAMRGDNVQQIIEALAQMRQEALEQHQETRDDDQ